MIKEKLAIIKELLKTFHKNFGVEYVHAKSKTPLYIPDKKIPIMGQIWMYAEDCNNICMCYVLENSLVGHIELNDYAENNEENNRFIDEIIDMLSSSMERYERINDVLTNALFSIGEDVMTLSILRDLIDNKF